MIGESGTTPQKDENTNNTLTHERRPPRVLAPIPQAYLIHRPVLAEYIVQLLGRYLEGEIADIQYAIHLRRQS
jgi:hypothetical protein